jgi:ubiquinol-cytochrome c reductase cytochrome b subunit
VGTYLSFLIFGGEFPGEDFISRLYTVHVLLVPGILLGLIVVHLFFVVFHKHTQYPGPGRSNTNVVGYPLLPIYIAKAGGFFFIVFGLSALLGGFATINPIWSYGAYSPSPVTAGSQPDWYIGWLEGALRLMPGLEITAFGSTLSLNVLIPAVIVPGIVFTLLGVYPFLEAWVTGDKREHHLLDRPRNQPVRTGLGVMALTFYTILFAAGGNDILAIVFGMSINAITWAFRVLIFVLPPLAFVVTKRVCLGLQRRDREKVLHGRETGVIMRLPHGEFVEVHEPISPEEAYLLTQHDVQRPLPPGAVAKTDAHGVPHRGGPLAKTREKLSGFYFGERIEPPTPSDVHELEASGHH